MKFRILIAATLLALASTSSSADQGVMECTIDGAKREALVFAPTVNTPNEKHPVVFAFHGHGGMVQKTSEEMNFQTVWPEAVVVYPQGVRSRGVVNDTSFDNPKSSGWQLWLGAYGDRDLKFFDCLVEKIRQKFAIDDNRIYAVGFSNGAYFCYLLWAQRRKTLAAVGIVAGALWRQGPVPVVLTGPLPVMQIAGIKDPVIPLAWQAETIEVDQKINNAPMKQGEPCGDACVLFPSSSGTPVKFRLHPGDHEYPNFASKEFVDFFKTQRRM